ncbi:MAG: excinuclease ABC subunit UvrA [Acholeplasmatales bacterium]|nr:excinuclease ABC subunit UvrA [Acholeplasmatales bacterium]
MDKIIVHGARENNLKNIDITLPKNKLIVMTGLSGSGKSSLAFDTIFQEGQRRFVESLSTQARTFIGGMDKPDVDSIEGLSPAISIDQKGASKNPRSTVGTVTEIYDYLRVLFSRIGTPYCPTHHEPIEATSVDQMIEHIMKYPEGERVIIMAPVALHQKGEHKALLDKYLKMGYIRAEIDGETYMLDEDFTLEKTKMHDIYIVIERLKMKPDIRERLADALRVTLKLGQGYARIKSDTEDNTYSEHYSCKYCGYSVPKLEPRLFSFNSPLGACPDCNGLGANMSISPDLLFDEEKSINKGGILPYKNQEKDNLNNAELKIVCDEYGIDMDKPIEYLTPKQKKVLLYGSDRPIKFKMTSQSGRDHSKVEYFEGILNTFERRYKETNSDWIREWIETFMIERECKTCHGDRLNEKVLNIFIAGKNIADLCNMSIEELYQWFSNVHLEGEKAKIAEIAIEEIKDRLEFLINVGLEYLTLGRSADTLSGGEAQRIRLATQVGSKLTGVLYVLDEPSIGLHQRDNQRLIDTLKSMRDLGNTLIVVEHDEDTMRQADWLVDVGPKAGVHGGTIMASGTPEEVMKVEDSITAKYLRGDLKIELPEKRRKGNGKFIKIRGAKAHNLKSVNVDIPLGTLTIVTGVSGSGKSSLVNEVLYKNLYVKLYKSRRVEPGEVKKIEGMENFKRVIQISQTPIGRTPRSNPATYTGVFDDIRELFAQTNEAKARGFDKGTFSFNVKGGRCEACWGDGVKKISMDFLPDVYVPCEVCGGTRYQVDTLNVKWKGKNIAEVLDMRIEEAYDFFKLQPKIERKLKALMKVGLGYMKLGQSSTELSGGEAQRVKLASELSSRITPDTLYIMDEPTTGLHTHDIKHLMAVINEIVDAGASVIIIEHNLDVIKLADYIVDLGPEGGSKGGTIVFQGTPEKLIGVGESYTAKYLAPYLEK